MVSIYYGPALILHHSSGLFIGPYLLPFLIFAASDSNYLVVITIHPISSIKSPELPPSGIGCSPLEILTISIAANFQRVVVLSISNSLCIDIEVPLLRFLTVLSLNDKVTALIVEVEVSTFTEY